MPNETSVYSKVYLSALEDLESNQLFEDIQISSREFLIYYLTVVSTFKWKNVPASIPYFMIERFLVRCGRVGFFKNDNDEFCLYPAFPAGSLLPNGEYDSYTLIAPDGTSFRRDAKDVEIIFNNSLKIPDIPIIRDFADKSSFSLQAVQTALERAMFPPVFTYDDAAQDKILQELQSKKKLLKPLVSIPKTGKYGSTPIERFPFFDSRETDVVALWDVFSRNDRLFYRNYGISTVGIQKNERLTEAESTGEEEMTRYSLLYDKYQNRVDACERIKKHFDYDISFEVSRDKKTVAELELTQEEKKRLAEIEATKGANMTMKGVDGDVETGSQSETE